MHPSFFEHFFFYFISGTKRYPWFLLADNLFREQVLGIKRAHFYWYLAVLRPSQWTETPTHAHFHEVILILQIPICQHWKDSFQFSFSNIYFIYLLTVRSKTCIILIFFHQSPCTQPAFHNFLSPPYPVWLGHTHQGSPLSFTHLISQMPVWAPPTPTLHVHPPYPALPLMPVPGSVAFLSFQHRPLPYPAQYHVCRT